jgi:nucleoside-diphosphate-sugar epimerase
MPSALLTGATGYIGSSLARTLSAQHWETHALTRISSDVSALQRAVPGVRVHRYDGSYESAVAAVGDAKPDVVFHLAAQTQSDHAPGDVEPMIRSNLVFGSHVVEAMTTHGCRAFVNTGTFWQHYENRDYAPVCLYAATKQAFECVLQYYVEARGLAALTLVLYDTYGPHDPRSKLMNLLPRTGGDGGTLGLSPGEQMIDLVYVDDVVDAYMRAAELLRDAPPGHRRYAVSSGAPLPLREMVKLYEEATGFRPAVEWGARPYREREVMAPWTRGETLPGWRPRVGLAEGIRRTHASLDNS